MIHGWWVMSSDVIFLWLVVLGMLFQCKSHSFGMSTFEHFFYQNRNKCMFRAIHMLSCFYGSGYELICSTDTNSIGNFQ